MKLHIVLIVAIVLITNKASCGVIGNVYDKVSNTTQDVKEDVYSWWSYGVETVMGEDINKNAANSETEDQNQSGLVGKFYNKVKGGVSSGYMKIHDIVLGKDSDPNKGIIMTFYERAMKRLTNIKSYIFGDHHVDEKPTNNGEDVKQEVLKLLFSNRTDIFSSESEKSALDSLRNKLTQTGDEVMHLADNEKDVLRRAYESVSHKSDDLLKNAGESVDEVKNKFNENIHKTQEFIQDESKRVNEAAKRIGEEVKKSSSDIETV